MRKLSEIKGEEALDVIAEILVPITAIANDDKVKEGFETNVAKCISIMLKKYKAEVMHILAVVDGKKVEDLDFDILELTGSLVELLNEPAVQSLFQ